MQNNQNEKILKNYEEKRYSDEILKITLNYLEKKLDKIEEQIEKRFESTEKENNRICHTVYGNGKIGLVERISNLEKYNQNKHEFNKTNLALFGLFFTVLNFLIIHFFTK
jgi:hypothetical protein